MPTRAALPGRLRRSSALGTALALVLLLVQVSVLGAAVSYSCAMSGKTAAKSCCCPHQPNTDRPAEPAARRAACCEIQELPSGRALAEHKAPKEASGTVMEAPLVAVIEPPRVLRPVSMSARWLRQRRVETASGPPLIVAKQSFLC